MRFAFGDCVLDTDCFELHRAGRPVKLEPKVYDVLVYLIERRDRVVTRRELLDTLWPGEAVSDSVLPRCIAAIRRAVGDSRERQDVITTLHGRGYRFTARLAEGPQRDSRKDGTPATPEPPGSRPAALPASDFVGRADGMDRLRALLARCEQGDGGIALVVGEPGIGKTRLAEELSATARAAGFEVLVGRCFEGEGAPAYWPWVQLLGDAVRATDDDATLREQLGSGAGDVAELVPEVRARIADLPGASGGGGEQARFRLYDAASRFLAARAAERPLLVVIDDLHWADASSLGLVRFLARTAATNRIVVVGTYRDMEVRRGHPLADLLGALARETVCERIGLSGLSADEISDYVRLLSGELPKADLVATLHEMTEGNPFFLREIVRLLAEDGIAARAESAAVQELVLPQGVRDAIGRRLDALSPECNDMLRAAAVLGRAFPVGLLEALLDLPGPTPRETLLELLGEALDAGTIVEVTRGTYAFAHALTRQTLYEELRAPLRISLHRRAGEAHESGFDPAIATDEQLAALAHHFLEAAPGGDVDKAVHYCVAAAESAQRKFAHDEAVGFFERALEAITLRVPVDEERRAELLLALGEARFTAGLRTEALKTLFAAADLARSVGRVDVMADAAIAVRGHGEFGMAPGDDVIALLQESLASLPEDDYTRLARLLSRLNGAAAVTMAERDALARQALAMAQRSGDPIALRDALSARWWATLGPDHIEDRYEVAREMRALADRTGDLQTLLLSLECELGADLIRGDFQATERNLDEYERVAASLRQPLFIFMGMNFRTSWLINRGRFAEAESRVNEALEYGRGLIPFAEATCKGQLYWSRAIRGVEGGDSSAQDLVAVLRDTMVEKPVSRVFGAMLSYSLDQDVAAAHARLADLDYRSLDRDEHWLMATTLLTEIASGAGDREMMEWLHEQLLPIADLMAVHDLLRAGRGSISSSLGMLAHHLGDPDAAIDWFERAMEKETAADMRVGLLVSQVGLAQALRKRGARGDKKRADSLIQASVRDAEALEMGRDSETVRFLTALRSS